MSSMASPSFSASTQVEGKHSEPATNRQPCSPRCISRRSSCTRREAVSKAGSPLERDVTIGRKYPNGAVLAPIGLREVRKQMRDKQFKSLRLPRLAIAKRAESGGALLRQDGLLQRELRGKEFILLDPAGGIERRQPDRERGHGGGVGGVEERHTSV